MNIPKTIAIGGITTVVIIGGVLIYQNQNTSPEQQDANNPEITDSSLLTDYQDLLNELNNADTKNSLLGDCDNPQLFAGQIQSLEEKLNALQQRKMDLVSDPRPGSEPLELSDGDYSDPRPGSEPLELSDGDYSDPRPGSEPLELSDGDYSDPRPGSEPLELSDGDYSDPRPGSEPLELSDGDYSDPQPGSEPLELSDGDYSDPQPGNIDQINAIENEIINQLNNLQTICDEEEPEESTEKGCDKACDNYISKCLSQVPSATQALFEDGHQSCVQQCRDWESTKIECMSTAGNCESMTTICGL